MLSKNPRTPSPLWSKEVETLCFGGVSQLRGQDDFTVSREDEWGHVLRNLGHQSQWEIGAPSLSESTENGSWMGLPTWQWPKTYGQGNKHQVLSPIFCRYSVSQCIIYLWLKLYTVPFFVSGQTYKISKGSNNYCSHCISSQLKGLWHRLSMAALVFSASTPI